MQPLQALVLKIALHKGCNQAEFRAGQIGSRSLQARITTAYLLPHSPPNIELPRDIRAQVILAFSPRAPTARTLCAALRPQIWPPGRAGILQGGLGSPI